MAEAIGRAISVGSLWGDRRLAGGRKNVVNIFPGAFPRAVFADLWWSNNFYLMHSRFVLYFGLP